MAYLEKAKEKIESVKGKVLTIEERREAAIEMTALLLNESRRLLILSEKSQQQQLASMMEDPRGKDFITSMTDECFRSKSNLRVADQLTYLLNRFGVPSFLNWKKRLPLAAFKTMGKKMASLFVPLAKKMIRKETARVIYSSEPEKMKKHLEGRREEGIRINLNHLGEAVLGEKEAAERHALYLADLKKPEVEYVSVKLSSIYSQINLLSPGNEVLKERLRELYRVAEAHEFTHKDGRVVKKFVNLDMEEYRDLAFTIGIFKSVLDEPEFFSTSAGIVLQAYLPDSFLHQQDLTLWAMQRVMVGGAPIKLRIVKGANLAMEQLEARLKGWPQAPYPHKVDVDANFKRMVTYGCEPEHAKAAKLGVASHNLFDISYALLLRAENGVEGEVGFEMLEGMADSMRRVVAMVSGDMLLYCPVSEEKNFQNAVAYLVRRLDENTAPENFLRHIFNLIPGTREWQHQASLFSLACHTAATVSFKPRRTQNRLQEKSSLDNREEFHNEPDTDFALKQNVLWAGEIRKKWLEVPYPPVPVVVAGKDLFPSSQNDISSKPVRDPSRPDIVLCEMSQGSVQTAKEAVQTAVKAFPEWKNGDHDELLGKVAQGLRKKRGDLIGSMLASSGKTVPEADVEVSEAIDFVEYYRRSLQDWKKKVEFEAKGPTLILSPWNFPCAIPCGGIAAALITGNPVIFKPAPEASLVGYELAKVFWEAGVSKEVLQFIPCKDDPVGSALVTDPRIEKVILTGGTATAKMLLKMRPGIDMCAETGGKNAIIATALSDRDLVVQGVINSAFLHAGQKCSACSLLILEKELYDDPAFLNHLKDAAKSLTVGSPWNFSTKVGPLIAPPNPALKRALTTLEEGEEWLLKPEPHPECPNAFTPGIKLGVKPGSFTHQTEFFGPVLGIMRAESLDQAIEFANGVPYGLTSGLQTLDPREKAVWRKNIRAGNCYINRGITGAIVQRQPFGGMKESSFGQGLKAGGPNYLLSFVKCKDQNGEEDYQRVYDEYFSKSHDPSHIYGQENSLSYVGRDPMLFRIGTNASQQDIHRIIEAAAICGTELIVSSEEEQTEEELISSLGSIGSKRVRVVGEISPALREAFAEEGFTVIAGPPLAAGRIELLRYLREVSVSHDYHRYGNITSEAKTKR